MNKELENKIINTLKSDSSELIAVLSNDDPDKLKAAVIYSDIAEYIMQDIYDTLSSTELPLKTKLDLEMLYGKYGKLS